MLKTKRDSAEALTTVIGPGTRVEGILEAQGILRIDGSVKGQVAGNAGIILGEESYVEADIEARELVIAGRAVGNVKVRERVEIKKGGSLKGDLCASTLIME